MFFSIMILPAGIYLAGKCFIAWMARGISISTIKRRDSLRLHVFCSH
jgi:hypothetical protein